jgi:hypothetical protein
MMWQGSQRMHFPVSTAGQARFSISRPISTTSTESFDFVDSSCAAKRPAGPAPTINTSTRLLPYSKCWPLYKSFLEHSQVLQKALRPLLAKQLDELSLGFFIPFVEDLLNSLEMGRTEVSGGPFQHPFSSFKDILRTEYNAHFSPQFILFKAINQI